MLNVKNAQTQENNIAALNVAETDLHQGLLKLFALAENYPDLKTNHSFLQLQGRISDLENSISDRRELYNDSVNLYNIRIHQIPDVIVAKISHFQSFDLLSFNQNEIHDVPVKNLFQKK